MTRWRWRGNVALLGVSLAFFWLPLLPSYDVINSDWPAFATGARLIVHDPAHLYEFAAQRRVELEVTGGRELVTLGIHGILPFLAPAWVALIAVPFDLLGADLGGRAWVLFGLLCLVGALYMVSRPGPPAMILPGFASVPTALMLVNAQLDGIVALGIGGGLALWSRPFLAGLALGLTLVKPQVVLPLGVALLMTKRWRVLAGWGAVGVPLLMITLALNPRWVTEWLGQTGSTVQSGAREVDFAHFAVYLPPQLQTLGLAGLAVFAICISLVLAARKNGDFNTAAAIVVIGGVVGAPHALPADLVLVAVGLTIWRQAGWIEWLALSIGALIAALAPAPTPAVVGVLLMFWLTVRISYSQQAPAVASAR